MNGLTSATLQSGLSACSRSTTRKPICSSMNVIAKQERLCIRVRLQCSYGRRTEQGKPLYFRPVVSFFFFFLLLLLLLLPFSLPNLSGRRLDVYHTSTHDVALVRIQNAGLKCAARGSLEMQDRKKLPKIGRRGTIAQICRAISSQLRHVSTIGKNLLNSNLFPICHYNRVNFGLLDRQCGAPLLISTGFVSWQRYCTVLQQWASAKFCGVEQRAPPILGRAAITLGIGPHSSCFFCLCVLLFYIVCLHSLSQGRCKCWQQPFYSAVLGSHVCHR